MNATTWFLLALPLALDVFAAGLVFGLAELDRSRWLPTAAGFAAIGGIVVAAGMLLGDVMEGAMGKAALYVAGIVLLAIGVRGIKHCLPSHGIKPIPALTTRKVLMTMVAVAVDKFAVGLSFAVLEAPLGLLTGIVAGQAFVAVLIGLWLGKRLGARAGDFAELIAGVVFSILGGAVIYKGFTGCATTETGVSPPDRLHSGKTPEKAQACLARDDLSVLLVHLTGVAARLPDWRRRSRKRALHS